MATQGRRVHSIEKAIFLLDCFLKERRALSLTELMKMTGWPKSTIHGMLASMLDSAVIEQNPADGKYRLGYHLFELGSAVHTAWDIGALARPRLLHIVATVNESAYLARLSGDELLLTDCAEPHSGFRVSSEVGSKLPLHCSSQGKAILSTKSASEVRGLLRRSGMPAFTPQTATTPDLLLEELALVRERGYAEETEEYRAGLCSVAAPIFNRDGACEFALGIVGVAVSAQDARNRAIVEVKDAAREISYELGWRP